MPQAHAQAQQQQQQQQQVTAAPRPVETQTQTNTIDTSDIATLNDALGSAGVDLRAEEETLQRSYDQHSYSYRTYEDRTRKQPPKPNFDTTHLSSKMHALAAPHKIQHIPADTTAYLALSLRARLQDLLTEMIAASAHRASTQFDRPAAFWDDGATPMWRIAVNSDVGKQLAALERAEREEEGRVRRERKERAEMVAASLAQQAPVEEEDMQPKKKKKKEGPGVTARNMSEDVRKKMSNAVASQAAGIGGKYAWMNAAASAPAPLSTKAKREAGTSGGANGGATNSWAKPYVPTKPSTQAEKKVEEEDTRRTVTLRDALFVIEKERGHGGGRGSARGWV
ncbi:hypothetical protein NEOLEDRAFT_1078611 [Neolentinus lepideus HHB14362 ss-1]|uniref:Transcription initiation factor TFIID subunit 4 n=1 Tax=Neolentinus lepideus HHB14362 ss-1 TaxID=1314782 RepID=A0A165N233_9AGAM|nr:hypothetical protein NEOLEDRAFT_1078611 [Neolentinus lepideus HHB14362 ss-1]